MRVLTGTRQTARPAGKSKDVKETDNMADFVLSCCSTADLTKEHFQQRDISYICFHYQLDGVDYPDDLGESLPFEKF